MRFVFTKPVVLRSCSGRASPSASPAPGRLIVWLNETQKFLGPGGLKAATVRHILARPQPVIIIGTIWPRHYDILTSTQDTTTGDDHPESHEILTILAQRKDLLAGFSRAELARGLAIAG